MWQCCMLRLHEMAAHTMLRILSNCPGLCQGVSCHVYAFNCNDLLTLEKQARRNGRQYQHIAPAPSNIGSLIVHKKKGIASSLFISLLSLFFSPLLPSLSSSLFDVLRMLCLPGMQDTQLGHPHHLGIHELIVGVNMHQSMYAICCDV